jgi:hypothetical protein
MMGKASRLLHLVLTQLSVRPEAGRCLELADHALEPHSTGLLEHHDPLGFEVRAIDDRSLTALNQLGQALLAFDQWQAAEVLTVEIE